jgi:hypothetical protein
MVSRRRLKRLSSVAAAVLAAFAAVAAAPARAATDDAEQAEALIREGVKLRARDNAAQALPVFEKAYQISRTPRTAAQLGLCELELGYYAAAERYLTEALAAPDHPWIAKNKAALKKPLELARANIGELALVVSTPGAEVSLNGKPVDKALLATLSTSGASFRLDKGPVDLEIRAPGYEPVREAITIVGGKREQRTYALLAAPKPVASEIRPGAVLALASPGSDGGAAVVGLTTAPAPAPAGARNKGRIAAWVTGGAAVGALVFGTVEAFSAAGKRDTFNAHTAIVGGVAYRDCGTANLSPACQSLKDDYDQTLTLSIVGFVAAGALAVTSSVLFMLSSPGHAGAERDGAARAFACVPDPVGRGLGCSLRF